MEATSRTRLHRRRVQTGLSGSRDQHVVDYSKYHNVRIDRQFAEGSLVPDVTHLQTSFD
jgi:hypothetical protein